VGLFVFGIILAVAGLIGGVAIAAAYKGSAGGVAGGIGVFVLGVGLFFALFAWAGVKSVPTKEVGVPVSYGKVVGGFYGPGAHETWTPWLHLTDIDETVQTTTFEYGGHGDPANGECDGALPVRIGGQQGACADVTIQWRVEPPAAGDLFQNYARSSDLMATIQNALVVRELKTVVNNTVGDYSPITDVQSITGQNTQTSQFTKFSPQIEKAMKIDLKGRIQIDAVYLPLMHYSQSVENVLQGISKSYGNFAVAQENVKVNQEQQKANAALGSPSQAALTQYCLNLVNEGKAPSGFQCFSGAGIISTGK
jgi:regulator of protease activity HflC (stomatin/prohibitin superfamily)